MCAGHFMLTLPLTRSRYEAIVMLSRYPYNDDKQMVIRTISVNWHNICAVYNMGQVVFIVQI